MNNANCLSPEAEKVTENKRPDTAMILVGQICEGDADAAATLSDLLADEGRKECRMDFVGRSLTEIRNILLANLSEGEQYEIICRFAEFVLPLYEQRNSGDLKLRQAIEAKRAWLAGEIGYQKLESAFANSSSRMAAWGVDGSTSHWAALVPNDLAQAAVDAAAWATDAATWAGWDRVVDTQIRQVLELMFEIQPSIIASTAELETTKRMVKERQEEFNEQIRDRLS